VEKTANAKTGRNREIIRAYKAPAARAAQGGIGKNRFLAPAPLC
jgi:hypothetical protein